MATLVSRELWNQPRCWSDPSRYRSAGKLRASSVCRHAAQLLPLSNHLHNLQACQPMLIVAFDMDFTKERQTQNQRQL